MMTKERATSSKKMQPRNQMQSLICRPDTPPQSSGHTMETEGKCPRPQEEACWETQPRCVESIPDMFFFFF